MWQFATVREICRRPSCIKCHQNRRSRAAVSRIILLLLICIIIDKIYTYTWSGIRVVDTCIEKPMY